jgi:hypothetical protein
MHLYWVTTEDHCEDWFVVANTVKAAELWFERHEGYDDGDATAICVLDIPDGVQLDYYDHEDEVGWPSESCLLSLGATFISQEPTRAVEIAGKKYCEGMLEAIIRTKSDDEFESQGLGRPNRTIPVSELKN